MVKSHPASQPTREIDAPIRRTSSRFPISTISKYAHQERLVWSVGLQPALGFSR